VAGYDDDTDGTEEIPLVVNPEYRVVIKTCLDRGELAEAEKLLTKATANLNGDATITPQVSDYRDLMVFNSIVSWNLTEKNGEPRPVTLENVKKLKGPDFEAIQNRVTALNSAKSPQEAAKIPG
jgi:hypothetical protein